MAMVIPIPNSTLRAWSNVSRQTWSVAAVEKEKRATDRASRMPSPPRDMQIGVMINENTKDRNAASAVILALDPAAVTGRPKDDTKEDTTLPTALTRATAAPAWDEDYKPLSPAESALCGLP
jgi:hypothetical protein